MPSVTMDSVPDDSSPSMRPLVKTGRKGENQASLAQCTDTGTFSRGMHAARTEDPEVGGN